MTRYKRPLAVIANVLVFAASVVVFGEGWMVHPPHAVAGALGLATVQHTTQRIIALLLLMVGWNLYRWKRAAWTLCVILLTLNTALSLLHPRHWHVLGLLGLALEVFVLIALLLTRDLYARPSARTTVRRAGVLAGGLVVIVVLNIVIGELWLFLHIRSGARLLTVPELVQRLGNAILGNPWTTTSAHSNFYQRFMFVVFWGCVLICLLLVLRSATLGRRATRAERTRARHLVLRYGQNALSYLSLDSDKYLFFGKQAEGVIAYGIVGDVFVVLGDPVCDPGDVSVLLSEFRDYYQPMAASCFILGATERFLEVYRQFDFGVTKCGEEAMFDLASYTTAGGAAMKLRQKIHRATRAGASVEEYKPLFGRDRAVEAAIARITDEWLAGKKSAQLGFSIGGCGLEAPMDRRYFIARDAGGTVCAFNVLIPYAPAPGQRGYLVDVTRRTASAPTGVTELLVTQGFEILRAEGVAECSLGLASLVHVRDGEDSDSADTKLLNLFFNHLNRFYGFKDLYLAKKKYAPTIWAPRFFVHTGKHLTPNLIYAAISIQSPHGLRGYFERVKPRRSENYPVIDNDNSGDALAPPQTASHSTELV